MKFRSRQTILVAASTLAMTMLGVAIARGQAQAEQTPQLAEDVFVNVPALGGLPIDEFMDTMGMFSASLGMTCTDCHVGESLSNPAAYGDETARKRTSRAMVQMVNAINRDNFGGLPFVSCYTCHRADPSPKAVPSLVLQYSVPPDDPNEIFFPEQAVPGLPTADQLFDRYIQALGGANPVANLTSFVANGLYSGYDTDLQPVPVEVFANAPDQRATVVHAHFDESHLRDNLSTYDGREGWIAAPANLVPLMRLTGTNLEGARTEAVLSFPAAGRTFRRWRVGFPKIIEGRRIQPIQGTRDGETPVNLFFDNESGLLVRLVRYSETDVGTVPTQIDYSDYRDVSGVMMPFGWTVTWTNGQSTIELSEIQSNVGIEAARFQRPTASPPR